MLESQGWVTEKKEITGLLESCQSEERRVAMKEPADNRQAQETRVRPCRSSSATSRLFPLTGPSPKTVLKDDHEQYTYAPILKRARGGRVCGQDYDPRTTSHSTSSPFTIPPTVDSPSCRPPRLVEPNVLFASSYQ